MISILQLYKQLADLKHELSQCILNDKFEEAPRILTGINIIKETLIEKYESLYLKSNVKFIE